MGKKSKSLMVCACLVFGILTKPVPSEPQKVKVADGEYSFVAMDGGLEESWELWRTPAGYLIEIERGLIGGEIEMGEQLILDRSLHVVRWEAYPEKGPADATLGCELGSTQLRCWRDSAEEKLEIESPYDVMSLSPWFLAGFARYLQAEPDKRRAAVKLVILGDGSPWDLMPFDGEVKYMGEEKLTAGGREFDARKYELLILGMQNPEGKSSMSFWLSREGVVLAHEQDAPSQHRIAELVRYEKYAEFGPDTR